MQRFVSIRIAGMIPNLSSDNERFIDEALASGLFPSREKLLDQAVEALRRRQDQVALDAALREGLAQLDAGLGRELSDADFDRIAEQAVQQASGRE